jgi:hypothetical protein
MDLPGLNFKPGLGFQATIHHRFNEPVNFFPRRGFSEFFLVASVGHCKFKLCENSIGVILQATLRGSMADFRPQRLSDRSFKFVVASRNVGFHIYNLKSFSCDQYQIFFNLWGRGGPNWIAEYKKILIEEDNQWTVVHHRKPSVEFSYHDAARRGHRLSGANRVPIGNRSSHFRALLNHFSRLYLDLQKDLIDNKHSSVFDYLEWPDLRHQLNDQQNSQVRNRQDVVLSSGSSRTGIEIQNSKGKQPIFMLKIWLLIWF